ncbi:MAG: biotin--[acetyl-CoA-carboxylase] ligase [Candidatus Krumholzibacteriia bacterium]|nr:biotin--[acetyl-CoA-carboxylase] ligase [bacterium]MCB9514910.1 biotin--[acetyl-CoA-carboxylase] ligase [Candidatus Latescibacterota bacterium]
MSSPSGESLRLSAREADWSAALRGRLGRPLEIHSALDSAMDRAHALGEAGAPAGACVLTEHQRRGRGRRANDWQDAPGDSLLLALLLRPTWTPARGGLLALGAGLALARAGDAFGLRLALKWPNDVLHGERKVAGVLSEARLSGDGYAQLVLGMGVNVHQRETDFAPALRGRASSLDLAAGRRLSRRDLFATLLVELEAVLDALDTDAAPRLLDAWRERWAHRGRVARDEAGRRLRLMDVDATGALRVESPTGSELLQAGELLVLEEDANAGDD